MRKSAMVMLVSILVAVGAVGAHHDARAATTTGAGTSGTHASRYAASYRPAPVCIGGCHAWHQLDPWQGSPPSILVNSFAPFASSPTNLAYAAWIRTSATDLALYPGYKGPGATAPTVSRGPMMIPTQGYPRLLAAFNSGFYETDAVAGFYVNHTLYFPMVHGLATVVRYTNGRVDIMAWSGGPRPGPSILMARQNLALLVNNSTPTPLSANNASWGLTLHGAAAVWRTALGIDAKGNLIYAAAGNMTSSSMAIVMARMHVVRAMQLDINPEWPIFVTYGASGARAPSLFVPNPNQIPGRFLYSSTKDFFAVFVTRHPGEPQPW